MQRGTPVWTALVAAFVGLALACASGGGSTPEASADSPYSDPPPESRLAKVEEGMDPAEVRSILGDPDHAHTYPTGKRWIPFYYGSDLTRSEWRYEGVGRVVFSHNRWSGAQAVMRVLYNPDERVGEE